MRVVGTGGMTEEARREIGCGVELLDGGSRGEDIGRDAAEEFVGTCEYGDCGGGT